MFNPVFFKAQGPLNIAVGERIISAWKTTQSKINGRSYITIDEGSDGNEKFMGKTFEVLAIHFGGDKIAFNGNLPVTPSNLGVIGPASFPSQGALDFAAGEQTISAWKTTQREINGRSYITIWLGGLVGPRQ